MDEAFRQKRIRELKEDISKNRQMVKRMEEHSGKRLPQNDSLKVQIERDTFNLRCCETYYD